VPAPRVTVEPGHSGGHRTRHQSIEAAVDDGRDRVDRGRGAGQRDPADEHLTPDDRARLVGEGGTEHRGGTGVRVGPGCQRAPQLAGDRAPHRRVDLDVEPFAPPGHQLAHRRSGPVGRDVVGGRADARDHGEQGRPGVGEPWTVSLGIDARPAQQVRGPTGLRELHRRVGRPRQVVGHEAHQPRGHGDARLRITADQRRRLGVGHP
jgi:hypothetical protein